MSDKLYLINTNYMNLYHNYIIISLLTHSNTVMQYLNGACIDKNVNNSKTLYTTVHK